jgi:putative transposase
MQRITTVCDTEQKHDPDLVKPQFTATRPNQLWVAGYTHVATWAGFI